MFFKNAQIYICNLQLNLNQLQAKLEKNKFRPCRKREPLQAGWHPPLGESHELLYHAANGCVMFCMRTEEKLLPANILNEHVTKKVRHIEAKEDRFVQRKERRTVKDEVLHDLLPQAFPHSKYTYGYLDMQRGYLIIDSGSRTGAEKFMNLLRESLGSLPVRTIEVAHFPALTMSGWLTENKPPKNVEMGSDIDLAEIGTGGSVVRCRKTDLFSERVEAHIDAGAQVEKVRITWNQSITLTLEESLAFKRLVFADKLIAEAEEAGMEDRNVRFDSDFAIMSASLAQLIEQMIEWFGGILQYEIDL